MAVGHNPVCQHLAHCNWGFIWDAVSPPCWLGPGAMPLEALAISPTPGFQIVFPCMIR